jgi:hypothetical protein
VCVCARGDIQELVDPLDTCVCVGE